MRKKLKNNKEIFLRLFQIAIDSVIDGIYRIDQSTITCMDEIALNKYDGIFNKWDFAPIEHREVDPDFQEYSKRCSDEISNRYSIELHFVLPEEIRDRKQEKNC